MFYLENEVIFYCIPAEYRNAYEEIVGKNEILHKEWLKSWSKTNVVRANYFDKLIRCLNLIFTGKSIGLRINVYAGLFHAMVNPKASNCLILLN